MTNAVNRRHDVAYIAETVFGTTPATPAFVALNTEGGFNLNKEVVWFEDTSIRSDRNRVDTYAGTYEVKGTLPQPLRPTEMDTFWESLCMGTWTTNILKNASTRKSVTMERAWQDIPLYQSFTGVVAESLNLSISNNSFVKATWGLRGMAAALPTGTSLDLAAGYTAQSVLIPFQEGTATISDAGGSLAYVTDVSLDITNDIASLNALGSSAPVDLVPDAFKVTGTCKAFFPSVALYTKFFNNTASTFTIAMTSGANSLTILLPKIRYTKADVPAGQTGPVEQDLTFEAFYDTTETATIKITRV